MKVFERHLVGIMLDCVCEALFIVDVSDIYNSIRLVIHTPAALVYSAIVVCSYVAEPLRSDTNQDNEL